MLPDVPTMDESGIKDFKSSGWTAVFAPVKTPADIITKMNQTLVEATRQASVRSTMEQVGNVVIGSTPAELAKFVQDESDTWGPIIKEANISTDG